MSRVPGACWGRRIRAFAGLFAIVVSIAPVGAADDHAEQLRALRQRIEALQQRLDASLDARDRVRNELRDAEREVGDALRTLHATDHALNREQAHLETLRTRAAAKRRGLQREIDALGAELRAAQFLGRDDYLKLLLSQEDPTRVARTLVYYRYFTAARARRIKQVEQGLAQLRALQQQVEQRRQALATLRGQQAKTQARLEQARRQRMAVLAQLNASIESHSQELERLRREEQGLTRLVNGLRQITPEPEIPAGARFAELKGRLPLPVAVRVRLAKTLGGRKGVVFPVPPGRPVRAVFPGRVAYADWLPGFGLLMIIEHGNGYMTLYGYNQSLYKSVGDWVEAGEVIALSGSTGGTHQPGLYFEVRHNGEARNPLDWLRR